MSHVKFSSPFIKRLNQSNISVTASSGATAQTILAQAEAQERRPVVIVQNQSSTATVYIILNETATVGLLVPPLASVSFDNYNGIIKAYASATSAVHLAYANS
jgi:hypothetical protein